MDLNILSYNSTGFNDEKSNFLNFLVNILGLKLFLLQEHMHLKPNLYKIQNKFPDFESFLLPAIRVGRNEFSGRPSGGLGIFWCKTLNNFVKIVKHPDSSRVQGIELFEKYVLLNVYFPTDPKVNVFDELELLKCLGDIKYYLDMFPDKKFVIGGDFNSDFSRQTRFTNLVHEFFMENSLFTAWSHFFVDFTFSQHSVRNGNNLFITSCIDHFMLQNNLFNNVTHAQAIHLGDNLSGHEPIFLSFKVDFSLNSTGQPISETTARTSRPMWSKASTDNIDNYRNDLKNVLGNVALNDGLKCENINCDDQNHLNDLDNFFKILTDSIDLAVNNNIPFSGPPCGNNVTPGWNDEVRPFRESARFWHSIWVSCGKPLNCEVFFIMKRTKNVFHYVCRKVKKKKEKIQQEKMLQHFVGGNITNLIKKLKNQRCQGSEKVSNLIDGNIGKANIANHFASKYSKLYNLYDSSNETLEFINELDINDNDFNEVELVTPEVVYKAILCIKYNSNDVNFSFKSNAIKTAADILYKHLTVLFQGFLIHGYVPKDLLSCSLKPIIKDKMGDKFSSENYRAIGSSSLFLKILDWVIFNLFEVNLKPADLQFGFQKKNSTTMCTWTVIETINYFNNRNSPVFACFLDLSKAFDLVDFAKLFSKLKNKIGKVFIRLLAFIYVFQNCCVEWAGIKSNSFKVSNGIRQGAVLSPTLFSIYINELFEVLSDSGFGCYINNLFYGLIGYADDLVLLSPDLQGLQLLLNITKSFLENLGLKISFNQVNPEKSKTKCMVFGHKNDPATFVKLNDFNLPWCDSYKHLGHILSKNGSLEQDADWKRRIFIGSFFELKQELKSQHPKVLMNLVMVYLSHFYGSNLWNLFEIDNVYVAWNKILRIVFNLPYCTHRYLLEPYSGFSHLLTMLTNRFLKFYKTLYFSEKNVISNLRICQENDCRSTFGQNVRNICLKNNVDTIFECKINAIKYFPIDDRERWRINILRDLISHKDNYSVDYFTQRELEDIIFDVACN